MTKILTHWDPEKLKRRVQAQVLDGMDRACHFVVERAREYAPVRSGKLRSEIQYKVIPHGTTVEGIIGVGRKPYWAWFQELGTVHHPAHPFLRPAVFNSAAEIIRLLVGR